ncbi:carbonic anhydrase-like [Neocloeon triangulifer]|uniref:carbonic anhydrase-like n=1 Tax=Neocloeon triangulifer TaxID=2078957 RepID=UPI00286ED50F|nr:carbonic anhydrase-like [Neocloeon triangulifer]
MSLSRVCLVLTLVVLWNSAESAPRTNFQNLIASYSEWPESCHGANQSPINLVIEDSKRAHYPALQFNGHWNFQEGGFVLKNTGHAAQIVYSGVAPTLTGGPLNSEYTLAQVHFHWGNTAGSGSEHAINNFFFELEGHFVHYNTKYGSVAEALHHPDGLAVVGVLFKGVESANNNLNLIVDSLSKIVPTDSQTLISGDAMNWFKRYDKTRNFFTYFGSLTTPPCSEVVTWIVLAEPYYIGNEQVKAFTELWSHEGPLESNFRPLQELDGRVVELNSKY